MTKSSQIADGIIVLGNITVAGVAKALSLHDALTDMVLIFSASLTLLRIIDWCVKRYRFGWTQKKDTDETDTETFKKE